LVTVYIDFVENPCHSSSLFWNWWPCSTRPSWLEFQQPEFDVGQYRYSSSEKRLKGSPIMYHTIHYKGGASGNSIGTIAWQDTRAGEGHPSTPSVLKHTGNTT